MTPGPGLLSVIRSRVAMDIYVMIRPRAGDFIYSSYEFEVMRREIDEARRLGANGFVLGILTGRGEVDVERTRELVERAAPLPVTFHRAIDMTPDPLVALEEVIATGARRVLSSGGAQNVLKGCDVLGKMYAAAGDRIAVMAGGGVTLRTVRQVLVSTGIREYHASLRRAEPSPAGFHKQGIAMGERREQEYLRYTTHEEDVQAVVKLLESVADGQPVFSAQQS